MQYLDTDWHVWFYVATNNVLVQVPRINFDSSNIPKKSLFSYQVNCYWVYLKFYLVFRKFIKNTLPSLSGGMWCLFWKISSILFKQLYCFLIFLIRSSRIFFMKGQCYRLIETSHFWPMFPFYTPRKHIHIQIYSYYTPKNTRKPKVFWCCQGVKYGNIGQKWSKYYNSNTSTMYMDMYKNISENYDISKTSKNTFWSISCCFFFFFRIILWNFRKNILPW